MSHDAVVVLVAVFIIWLIWYFPNRTKTYIVEDYFFREIIEGREDFKYARINPYYSGGYFVSCVFGNDKFILRQRDFQTIYGAKVEKVMDDLCWDFRIPKGSLYSKVSPKSSEVTIKKKGGK